MAERPPIYVYADWVWLEKPALMGVVHRSVVRGQEVLAFEYEQEWLKQGDAMLLDPRLQLVQGRQVLCLSVESLLSRSLLTNHN